MAASPLTQLPLLSFSCPSQLYTFLPICNSSPTHNATRLGIVMSSPFSQHYIHVSAVFVKGSRKLKAPIQASYEHRSFLSPASMFFSPFSHSHKQAYHAQKERNYTPLMLGKDKFRTWYSGLGVKVQLCLYTLSCTCAEHTGTFSLLNQLNQYCTTNTVQ